MITKISDTFEFNVIKKMKYLTIDIIISYVFGVKLNSFINPNDEILETG